MTDTVQVDTEQLWDRIANAVYIASVVDAVTNPGSLLVGLKARTADVVRSLLQDVGPSEWTALARAAWKGVEERHRVQILFVRPAPQWTTGPFYFPPEVVHARKAETAGAEWDFGHRPVRFEWCSTILTCATQFCPCGEVLWVVDPWEAERAERKQIEAFTRWTGGNPRRDVEEAVKRETSNTGMEELPAEDGQ